MTFASLQENRFYRLMAGVAVLLGVVGLVPPLMAPRAAGSELAAGEGLLRLVWGAVLIIQITLIGAGRREIHQKLGAASVLLLGGLIASAAFTAAGAAHQGGSALDGVPALAYFGFMAASIAQVSLLAALGLWNIRTPERHKRYMLAVQFSMTQPAVLTLVGLVSRTELGAYLACVPAATLIVVMILRDLDREGHAPAPWAIALASLAAEAGFTAWAFSQPAEWLALARMVAA